MNPTDTAFTAAILKTHAKYANSLKSSDAARAALQFEAQQFAHKAAIAKEHGGAVHSSTARNWRSLGTALRSRISHLTAQGC